MRPIPEPREFLQAAVDGGDVRGGPRSRVVAFLAQWDEAKLQAADPSTVGLLDRMAGPCRTMNELAARLEDARTLVEVGGRDAVRWLLQAHELALSEKERPRRRRIVGAPRSAARGDARQ